MDPQFEKRKIRREIEKKLLPRLRAIGLITLGFAVIGFGYAIISDDYVIPESAQTTPTEEENAGIFGPIQSPLFTLTGNERKKCLIIGTVFTAIGIMCICCAHKKRKEFEQENE